MNVRRILATACASGAIVTGSMLAASPAQAQPVVTGGLVNVTIVDLVDIRDVVVQVPVAAAANICDVNAAVLLAAIEDTGSAECTATATSRARN